jgi:putative Mn2+ efflux pump MntP
MPSCPKWSLDYAPGTSMLRLLLFVLPLGFDTLGVSISLGIKSQPHDKSGSHHKWGSYVQCGDPSWGAGNIKHVSTNCPPGSWGNALPAWVGSALLFSLAETVMPLVGLTIGSAVSLFVSSVMHILGPLLLIGVGLWELLQEVRERTNKRKKHQNLAADDRNVVAGLAPARSIRLGRQLLLALSVSVDELAIGFSLGAITSGLAGSQTINTITLCILIGLQGFLMTLIGLTLGRTLRVRLKSVKEWTEFLSCFLLIALGVWLLVTSPQG